MMTSDDKVGGWVKKGQNHDDVILEWSLTEPSNSGWAKAHLAHPLTTSMNCTYVSVHLRWIWNNHYTRVTSFSKSEK